MFNVGEGEKAKAPHKSLVKELRDVYREQFGAPLAGRIKNIAPFYPFDLNEQAVVARKFLLELADDLRKPINLTPAVSRLVGHAYLAIENDGKLCLHLVKEEYHAKLGARSPKAAVDAIQYDFYTQYVDTNDEVEEMMNAGPLGNLAVGLQPYGDGDESETYVERDGVTRCYRGQGAEDDDGLYLGQVMRDTDAQEWSG